MKDLKYFRHLSLTLILGILWGRLSFVRITEQEIVLRKIYKN